MKKNLLFFTDKFPYGVSETFIESEIPFLEKEFEQIYIICTSLEDNNSDKRALPEKFKVINGYKLNFWDKTVVSSLGAIIHMFDTGEKWKRVKEVEKVSLKNKAYYGYTLSRANCHVRSIIPKIKKLGLNPKDTIIYSYWFNNFAYIASEVNKAIFNSECKIVTRAHRMDLYDLNKYYSPLKAIAIYDVNKVYACSKDGCTYLQKKYAKFSQKFSVSYLGTKDYGIGNREKSAQFNICSCSYIKPVKRVHKILEALLMLDDPSVNIHWTHFGDGHYMDHKFEDRVSELPPNITATLYGEIKNATLMAKYKSDHYDLFINVSESEGLPVSIMEAISFGIPVIATNVGGTREIVDDKTGILLDKDFSSKLLAEKILYFYYLSPNKKKQYMDNCRKKWEQEFDSSKNYEAFMRELREEIE